MTGLDESGDDIPADPPEIRRPSGYGEADSDDFDLTDANTFKPSAMAVSFQCRIPPGGSLAIAVSGAYYDRLAVHIPGVKRSRDWWLRRPFTLAGNIPGDALLHNTGQLKVVRMSPGDPEPRIVPAVRVYSRLVPGSQVPGLRLVTVAVVNEAHGSGPVIRPVPDGLSDDGRCRSGNRPVSRGRTILTTTRKSSRLTCSTATGAPSPSGTGAPRTGGSRTTAPKAPQWIGCDQIPCPPTRSPGSPLTCT